ncbi:MAG: YtxH domain-containing protein [Nitrospirales bacterium]|nr:YtxH domain-containing protein [Nitrospirales bacterium]
MRNDEGFGPGSVLLSFLLGGMVGAGLTLLVAPQSGQETRRRIREFADDARERANDYVSQAKGRVISTVEKGKDLIDEKKTAVTAAFEAGKEAYEKEINRENA